MEIISKSRKRKFLSLEEKADVIKQIENGRKKCDVGKQYGLVSSTVQSIWKNRDNILQSFEMKQSGSVVKGRRLCKPDQQGIDQALLKWFYQQRSQNYLVSGPTLRAKAEEFARDMHYNEFVCTKSWLDRFKVRHKISLYGKVNSEGERSSGESSQYNADDNDELEEDGRDGSGSASFNQENDNEEEDRVEVEKHKEIVFKHEQNLCGVDSNSDTDEDSDALQKEVTPTMYNALDAIRTLKRYYGSNDNERLASALQVIDDDLDQQYWTVLRETMVQMCNTNGNHASDTDDND